MTGQHGYCSHCRQAGVVAPFRLWSVGVRHLCFACADRFAAMGMRIDLLPLGDPRRTDAPVVRERRRFGWLRRGAA